MKKVTFEIVTNGCGTLSLLEIMTMEAPKTAVEAAEIRLGNWFEHLPEWSHRNETWKDPERFVFQWEERDWFAIGWCLFSLDRISPIPITAEMLVKSGFIETRCFEIIPEFNQGGTYYVKQGCGGALHFCFMENVDNGLVFKIESEVDKKRKIFSGNEIPHIKYIHQLQNIFHSLTGTELEIKWR